MDDKTLTSKNLKDILETTYGIIVYQEQILQVAQVFAGFSLSKADILRRAMSKKDKDKMIQLEEEFIKGGINKGHSEEKSKDVYELILKFASYGFNKAHSVSYAMISMYMMYLKLYYPSIFFACTMEMFTFSEKFNEYLKAEITLSEEVSEEDANALAEELEQRFPDCDVNMISGEQPVYYYIISIE